MARVEIASMPWGTVQDGSGNAQSGVTVNLKNLDGTAATTWSAVTGGASSTASLTTDVNGTLSRFVDAGQYLIDVPALSITGRHVEAASGAMVEKGPTVNTTTIFHGIGGYVPDGSGIPNQVTPITTQLSTGGLYTDSGSGNLFHFASYTENTGTRATVSVFGGAKGNHVFGGNFVGYSNGASDVAIATEFDAGNLSAAGGTAHGVIVRGSGGVSTNLGGAIQIQASTGAEFAFGIKFHVSGGVSAVQSAGKLITCTTGLTAAVGLDLAGGTFSTAAIVLPDGGNIALNSTTGTKIGTSVTQKLGFFNKAPVAQQSLAVAATDAATTQTLANSLRTALINLGLGA